MKKSLLVMALVIVSFAFANCGNCEKQDMKKMNKGDMQCCTMNAKEAKKMKKNKKMNKECCVTGNVTSNMNVGKEKAKKAKK